LQTSNLVKIIPVQCATCDMFKVIWSNRPEIEIWQIFNIKLSKQLVLTSEMLFE